MPQAHLLLDRNGGIKLDSDNYIKSSEECVPIPKSFETIYCCPGLPDVNGDCRKQNPVLLKSFAKDNNFSLLNIYFIRNKLANLQATEAAGARPLSVKTGKGQRILNKHPDITHPIFENLYDTAKFINSEK